jgi:hypothetical protein
MVGGALLAYQLMQGRFVAGSAGLAALTLAGLGLIVSGVRLAVRSAARAASCEARAARRRQ